MNINVAIGWISKFIVLALSLINTRLLIESIGTNGLAAYSIILSLSAWIGLLNLGLPITAQNSISKLRGRNRNHQRSRNEYYGAMIIISIFLSPVVILMAIIAKFYILSDYSYVSGLSLIFSCLFIYINSQSQLMNQVLYAENMAFWPNFYPALMAIYTTMALILAVKFQVNNVNYILILLTMANIIMPIHSAIKLKLFKNAEYSFKKIIKNIYSARGQLLFAFLSNCVLAMDYIIMSQNLSAEDIVEYNLTSRIYGILLIINNVIIATNWTPMSDLLHGLKLNEAKLQLEKILKQGLLLGGLVGLLIIIFMNSLTSIWTGGKVSSIPLILGISLWLYALIRIWTDTFSMALLGYGMAGKINAFIVVQAVISIVLQIFLGNYFGSSGVVLGQVISFLLTVSWILPKIFYKIVRM